MSPVLEPLTEISIQPARKEELEVDQIVAFQRGEGILARRVLFIDDAGQRVLVQGDNRPYPELIEDEDEVLGKIDGPPLARPRRWSRLIPPRLWIHALSLLRRPPGWMRSVMPGVKNLLRKLGPADNPRPAAVSLRRRSGSMMLQVRPFLDSEIPGIVSLWNLCFPSTPLDEERFARRIQASPWFCADGLLVARDREHLLGFVLASDRRGFDGQVTRPGVGFIEALGVRSDHRRRGIGSGLLHQAMGYLGARGCRRRRVGPFLVALDGAGELVLEPSLRFFGALGYSLSLPAFLMQMDFVASRRWKPGIAERALRDLRQKGVEIRIATREDIPEVRNLLVAGGQGVHGMRNESTDASAYLIGTARGKILGCVRLLFDEDGATYDQFDTIWHVTAGTGRSDLGSLYVVPEARHLGLGAGLILKGFAMTSARSTRIIWGSTSLPALRSRYERWGAEVTHMVFQVALDG